MKLKKSKSKNVKNLKQYNTLSGLNSKTSGSYIIAISVILGIVIFAMIPYVSNRLNRPITSSILNVVPNGMILGFFIVEKNFDIYFKSLIFAPLLNTVLDIIVFTMYKYFNISAIISITTGIVSWLILLILAYIYT
jgi:hypothetical protein